MPGTIITGANGSAITDNANGAQNSLAVGIINPTGTQVDPTQIRPLTAADVVTITGTVTANQGITNATPWNINLADIAGTATVTGGVAGLLAIGGSTAIGSPVSGNPVTIGGSDGTNVREISVNTKGTQGAFAVAVQELKDTGRNTTNYFYAVGTMLISASVEALASLAGYKSGAFVASTGSWAVVTSGKIYRIQSITLSYVTIATTPGSIRFNLLANLSGLVTLTSPVVCSWIVGEPTGVAPVAGKVNTVTIPFPDGLEFAAGTGLGISYVGLNSTGTFTKVGYSTISVVGYEY